MNTTKTFLNVVLAAGLLCASVSGADAAVTDKKVVRGRDGQIVRAHLSGTCVRTDWQAPGDPCAPAPPPPKVVAYVPPPAPPPPPPAPVVVQQRQDILTSDEKIVYFNFNSAQLTPGAKTKLDSVAAKLSAASSVKGADIVGYADRIGSNSYNMGLSQKRSKAVHDYLAQRGYLNTQIAKVRGLGKSAPITNCPKNEAKQAQIECLGADRRVELEVQYTKTEVKNVLVQPPAPAYAPTPARGAAAQPMPAAYPVQGEMQPVPAQGEVVYRAVAP